MLRNLVILAIAIGALVGAFLLLRPNARTPASRPEANVSAPATVRIELDLRTWKRPLTTRIEQGAPVTLRVTANEDDALHLHGYDLHLELVAGKTAEMRFVADRTGRFEYELHEKPKSLGAIEVYPRGT